MKENKIYYDEIIFDVKDKGKYCKDNTIDIMIEDDPINLRKLVGNTNVIIFDYPYNRNIEFADLTRAYSWYDIYYKIKSIEESKNNIEYDKLIVNAREKAPICEEEKIDLFIDDQLNNCIDILKTGISTIKIG